MNFRWIQGYCDEVYPKIYFSSEIPAIMSCAKVNCNPSSSCTFILIMTTLMRVTLKSIRIKCHENDVIMENVARASITERVRELDISKYPSKAKNLIKFFSVSASNDAKFHHEMNFIKFLMKMLTRSILNSSACTSWWLRVSLKGGGGRRRS